MKMFGLRLVCYLSFSFHLFVNCISLSFHMTTLVMHFLNQHGSISGFLHSLTVHIYSMIFKSETFYAYYFDLFGIFLSLPLFSCGLQFMLCNVPVHMDCRL